MLIRIYPIYCKIVLFGLIGSKMPLFGLLCCKMPLPSFISCDPDIIKSQIKVQNTKVIVYFYLVGINIQNKT